MNNSAIKGYWLALDGISSDSLKDLGRNQIIGMY